MLENKDNVKFCYDKTCVEAKGNNGKLLIGALALTITFIGIAYAIKS